jgi:hypothetical protein
MRRIVLVLALTAFFVVVVFAGSGLAQEIPPDRGGGPETGCEGIRSANDAQDVEDPSPEDPHPPQGEEKSAAGLVANAHSCRLAGPPYEPGTSGGQ